MKVSQVFLFALAAGLLCHSDKVSAVTAHFSVQPGTSVSVGEAIVFDASGSTDDASLQEGQFHWDFGDGYFLTSGKPLASSLDGGMACLHIFMKPGTFTVTLTVTDTDENTDTFSREITVAGQAPIDGFELLHAPYHCRIAQYIYVRIPASIRAVSSNKLKVTLTNSGCGFSQVLLEKNSMAAEERFLLENAELAGAQEPYVLKAELLDANNTSLSSIEEKFTKSYDGKPRIGINEHNALCVNGQPFFPVTPFMLDKPYLAEWSTKNYINTLCMQGYYSEGNTLATWQDYVNLANSNNLYVMGPGRWEGFGGQHFGRNSDITEMVRYVTATKDDSALFAWFWDDEPNMGGRHQKVPPAVLSSWSYVCHKNDPHHPTYSNQYGYDYLPYYYGSTGGNGTRYDYLASGDQYGGKKHFPFDILSFDIYPLEYRNHPALVDTQRGVMDLWIEAIDNMIAWNYNLIPCMSYIEVCDIRTSRETPGPTAEQVLMEAWLNVVHGVKGISWFPFFERDTIQYSAMASFTRKAERLAPAILSPASDRVITDSANERGNRVDTMVREYGGKVYLFAVRLTEPETEYAEAPEPEQISVTFTAPGFEYTSGEVLDESRTVTLQNRKFTDTFNRCAVHIYVFGSGEDLGSEEMSPPALILQQ